MARRQAHHRTLSKAQIARQARPKAVNFLSESESAPLAHSTKTRPQEHAESDEKARVDTDDVEELDAPRVAQWIDDEEWVLEEQTDGMSAEDEDDSENELDPSRQLDSLQDNLSALPLGALRSAQRSLAQAHPLSDTESDSEEQPEDDTSVSLHPAKSKDKEKPDRLPKPHSKRTNKHAPTEVTSKRPVSRRRVVVEGKLQKPRDPRFIHASGRYDPSKFKQQYEFLSGLHNDERSTLREHVKRARKLLANSPADLKAEREEEVTRLERALKKAESTVNQDNRERVELAALQSVKQTEMEKRRKGKADWWMKRSEKKDLLAKARLDAIASVGGKRAVKKALEKKQKKRSQKEKKTRPFSRSEGAERSNTKKRHPAAPVDPARGRKRRKVA